MALSHKICLLALRRGSVYLPILLIATVAGTLTIGGLLVVQSHSRSVQMRSNTEIARANAFSAIEAARARMMWDANWRANNTNGEWISNESVPGGGTMTVSVTNPFGVLSRQDTDDVIVTGTGKMGTAVQTVSVVVEPGAKTPLTCLEGGICVAEDITFSAGRLAAGAVGIITANNDITTTSGDTDVRVNVEASGVIAGAQFRGTATAGVAKRTFPTSNVFDQYPSATSIPVGSLASYNGVPSIRNCLLAPAVNPFGSVNSRGIYLIDCQGAGLIIRDCRIVGTVIVKNAAYVLVTGSVNWYPAETTLPALLVQGRLTLEYQDTLAENSTPPLTTGAQSMNLNPAGSPFPYPGGIADSDTSDSYSSYIGGLIYSSTNVGISGKIGFHSLVVGGTLWVDNVNNWTFSRDTTYYTTPPPGFYTMRHTVIPGTYK